MTDLLDGNVLVALVVEDHVNHVSARTWWVAGGRYATCPITQGTLLRLLIRGGMSSVEALAVLAQVTAHDRHEFWVDDLSYEDVGLSGVFGPAQVTDTYLAELARSRGGRIVTFDRGLAALNPDVAELLGSD